MFIPLWLYDAMLLIYLVFLMVSQCRNSGDRQVTVQIFESWNLSLIYCKDAFTVPNSVPPTIFGTIPLLWTTLLHLHTTILMQWLAITSECSYQYFFIYRPLVFRNVMYGNDWSWSSIVYYLGAGAVQNPVIKLTVRSAHNLNIEFWCSSTVFKE